MGVISGLLGTAGGQGGTGIAGPAGAPIQNPTNAAQIQGSYSGVQNSLVNQNALLAALQNQQGLQNQSNVYGQLQNVVAGQGPNPAQAMLSQATGANVANQAALMAGQRGANANVGLIGRQAAQQGAATQQQAANQAAVLQANQSLNALGQAGQIASNQAANQIGQTNAFTQANQAEQNALLNAQQGVNQAGVSSQGSINAANAGLANTTMQGQQAMIGGLMQGIGGGASAIMGGAGGGGAAGGEVVRRGALGLDTDAAAGVSPSDVPAPVGAVPTPDSSSDAYPGVSKFGQFLAGAFSPDNQQMPMASTNFAQSNPGAAALQKGASSLGGSGVKGAAKALPLLAALGKGGPVDLERGGKVDARGKGEKAVARGNDYANDKIPALLSEHEIVIPRNITMGKNPAGDAAKFVAAIIAQRKNGGAKNARV